jgi:hypothetical protein
MLTWPPPGHDYRGAVHLTSLLLALALLATACGDDTGASPAPSAAPSTTQEASPGSDPSDLGAAPVDCQALVDEYVAETEQLFAATPSDDRLEAARARFDELDATAGGEGCGDAYRAGICEALDDLSREGTLIIFPMLTAQCL